MNIFTSDHFPLLKVMENSYNDICDEYDKFDKSSLPILGTTGSFQNMQNYTVGVTGAYTSLVVFNINIDSGPQSGTGKQYHRDHFPNTLNILKLSNDCIPISIFFNTLYPNTKIDPHTDSLNKTIMYNDKRYERLRAHMGVHVPDNCRFTINYRNVKCAWEEGKAFAWYPHETHSAQNNNKTELRTILLVDFLCPSQL